MARRLSPSETDHVRIALITKVSVVFAGALEFKITRNSVLHGFACWFDCVFDGKHPVTLGTGPDHPPTHWQQTVILLPEALLVRRALPLPVLWGAPVALMNVSFDPSDGYEGASFSGEKCY